MTRDDVVIRAAPPPAVVVPSVLEQHAEEANGLFSTRTSVVRSPAAGLHALRRLDDRLAAHLDGLAVAGDAAQPLLDAGLEPASPAAVFCAAVRAIEQRQSATVERLIEMAAAAPALRAALVAAFEWVHPKRLQGVVAGLLGSSDPCRRLIAVAACARHRVDPGAGLMRWAGDAAAPVRARALRLAGELGRLDLAPACLAAMGDDEGECWFWAAWSSVLFGNRGTALDVLARTALVPGARRMRACHLALQAMSAAAGHAWLTEIARDPHQLRVLIQGSGIAGDPIYVPWLIGHMSAPPTARLAGEAFTLMTGVDLGAAQLDDARPDGFEPGPSDDPDDANVEMDPDDGLAWPAVSKIEAWWETNASRFQQGARYFMGAPAGRAHALDVLRNGSQRQRMLAAHHLSLLDPGTPLFNTAAPAWRQSRLLAGMT